MIYKMFSKRVMAVVLAFLITVLPLTYVNANTEYIPYEFVVDSNVISADVGDEVVITVTVNGPMSNARMVSYRIEYLDEDFSVADDEYDALDSDWFNYVASSNGLGAIAFPGVGTSTDESKPGKVFFNVSFVGTNKFAYISEGKDIYGANTAVAGKIKFTAKKYIEDISTHFTLINAENEYGDTNGKLGETCNGIVVQLSETIKVTKAINAINEIVAPITYSSKSKIEAARAAYDAVLEKLQSKVTNHSKLTDAEDALGAIVEKMDNVKKLIDALDSTSSDFQTKVEAAREAFNALANDEKAALLEYETKLVDAEQKAADKAKAQEVIAQIAAIGDVTLDDADENGEADSKTKIEAARVAYEALTDAQKGYVSNLAVLVDAESKLAQLETFKAEAAEVEKDIADIPDDITKANMETAREKISIADKSYQAFEGAEMGVLISGASVAKLENAKKILKELDDKKSAAEAVDDQIDKIGNVTLDDADENGEADSETKIKAAVAAYEALDDEARSFVTKKADLDAAQAKYEKLVADENAVQAVITLINNLPAKEDITPDTEEAYNNALESYNNLETDDLRARVDKVTGTKLTDVKREIAASNNRINAAKSAIENIGEVTSVAGTMEKISAAKAAYSALEIKYSEIKRNYPEIEYLKKIKCSGDKSYYDVYTEAVAKFEALEKTEAEMNQQAASYVIGLINSIGDVEITDVCLGKITLARTEYDNLTDAQKALVDESYVNTLNEAEETYDKAYAVVKVIKEIGNIIYDPTGVDDSLAKIDAAQDAYDSLNDEYLQGLIYNYEDIEKARNEYESKKADYEAIENVKNLISDIANATDMDDRRTMLTAAQDAYDALKDELKAQLTEQKKALDDAWDKYKYVHLDMTMSDGVTKKNLVVFTNIPEGQMIELVGYDVSVIKFKDGEDNVRIYNLIVTEGKLEDLSGISFVNADSKFEILLGDVDDSRTVTATDALIANKYAARVPEALKIFADDAMAFVRADVNRSGTVSGLDALMIAQKAVNNELFEDDPFADAQFEACIKKAE